MVVQVTLYNLDWHERRDACKLICNGYREGIKEKRRKRDLETKIVPFVDRGLTKLNPYMGHTQEGGECSDVLCRYYDEIQKSPIWSFIDA